MPLAAISRSSSQVYAMPPPVPPSVYAGRMMTGRPIFLVNSTASSTVWTTLDAMIGSLIFSIVSLNS